MRFFGPAELIFPTHTSTPNVCLLRGFLSILRSLSFFTIGCLFVPALHAGSWRQAENGIRIDLPSNGQLRIENQFGDIDIRVGNERDVLIIAQIDGAVSGAKSPVVIETRQMVLSISVAPRSSGPPGRVNLSIRIPERVRAEIFTNEGQIAIHGQAASMTLNTVSGRILAELDSPLDADVSAVSTEGTVRAELGSPGGDDHTYRSRFGQGLKFLRANSRRGEIVLTATSTPEVPASIASAKPPELKGADGSPGAGTPASSGGAEEVDEGDVVRVDAQLVTLNLCG